MIKIGKVFIISAPRNWLQFHDQGREVFQGPRGEEFIVSAALIQGVGQSIELTTIQKQLFDNAQLSVKQAAAHPDLVITQPFEKDKRTANVDRWILYAQTKEKGMLFYQALFRDPRGVLIVTFEAPNTKESIQYFDEFVSSVEVLAY